MHRKAEEIVVCNQCSVGQIENKMALQSLHPRWGHRGGFDKVFQ